MCRSGGSAAARCRSSGMTREERAERKSPSNVLGKRRCTASAAYRIGAALPFFPFEGTSESSEISGESAPCALARTRKSWAWIPRIPFPAKSSAAWKRRCVRSAGPAAIAVGRAVEVARFRLRAQRRARVVDPPENGQAERRVDLQTDGVPGVLGGGARDPLVGPGEDPVPRRVEERPPAGSRERRRRPSEITRLAEKEVEIPHRAEPRLRVVEKRERRALQRHDLDARLAEVRHRLPERPSQPGRACRRRRPLGSEERRDDGRERADVGKRREQGGHALDRRRERRELAARRRVVPRDRLAERGGRASGERGHGRFREETKIRVRQEARDVEAGLADHGSVPASFDPVPPLRARDPAPRLPTRVRPRALLPAPLHPDEALAVPDVMAGQKRPAVARRRARVLDHLARWRLGDEARAGRRRGRACPEEREEEPGARCDFRQLLVSPGERIRLSVRRATVHSLRST